MSSDSICPGCSKTFSRQGISHHWSQTQNANCQRAYQSLLADTFDDEGSDDEEATTNPETRTEQSPTFAVDRFGADYSTEDFEMAAGNNPDDDRLADEGGEGDKDEMDRADEQDEQDEQDVREEEEMDEVEAYADEDARILEELMAAVHWGAIDVPILPPASVSAMAAAPEPTVPPLPAFLNPPAMNFNDDFGPEQLQTAHRSPYEIHPIIHKYPGPAGAEIGTGGATSAYEKSRVDMDAHQPHNVWAPFHSKLDWKMAYWAKTRGPTSSAVTELLQMDEVSDRLGLSYKNVTQLNKIIDEQLPDRPTFRKEEIRLGGETYDLYLRDVIPCIRALFGDPEFAKDLALAPERHYKDEDMTIPIYNEMHTGRWWWSVQKSIESIYPGATIIPLIFSSDKTQLTMFRNKAAYPVYMTIGNITKDSRRKPSC